MTADGALGIIGRIGKSRSLCYAAIRNHLQLINIIRWAVRILARLDKPLRCKNSLPLGK